MEKIIKGSDESVEEFLKRVVEHPVIAQCLQPFLNLPWFPPILLGWYASHTIAYSAWRQGPSEESVCALRNAVREYTDIQDFDLEDATTCVTGRDWSRSYSLPTYRRDGEITRRLAVSVKGVKGIVVFRREPMILGEFPKPCPSF